MNDTLEEAFKKIIDSNGEAIAFLKDNRIQEAKEILTETEQKLKKTIKTKGSDQKMYAAMILTLNNFCLMYKKKKNFDKALDYLMRIKDIEVNNLNSSRLDIATTHLNISTIFHFQKKYDLSIRHVNGAKDILVGEINYIRELNGKDVSHNYKKKLYLNLILALYNRGVEYEKMGDKETAKKNYKDSRELAMKKFGIDQPITDMINENLRKNFGSKRKPFFVSKNVNIDEIISNINQGNRNHKSSRRGLLELAYPNASQQQSLNTRTHRSEDLKKRTDRTFHDAQSYHSHKVKTNPPSLKSRNSFDEKKSRLRVSRSFSRKNSDSQRLPKLTSAPYHRIATPKSTQKLPYVQTNKAQIETEREISNSHYTSVRQRQTNQRGKRAKRNYSEKNKSRELSKDLMSSLHKYSSSPKQFENSLANPPGSQSGAQSSPKSNVKSRVTGVSHNRPMIPALKYLKHQETPSRNTYIRKDPYRKKSSTGTTKSTHDKSITEEKRGAPPPKKLKMNRVSFALKYMN